MKGNIWEFHVKEGCERQFIALNERNWPNLFENSQRYHGTDIIRLSPLVYWVIDKWKSKEDFEEFKESNGKRYYELVSMHEDLYHVNELKKLGWMELDPKINVDTSAPGRQVTFVMDNKTDL
jgi:hypothetical protein